MRHRGWRSPGHGLPEAFGKETNSGQTDSITAAEKRGNAAAYGYSGPLSGIEYDHLVPLELGGDPNDPRNLWVEPGESPNPKDGIESKLHQLVCEGRVPLAAAQGAIANDWTTAMGVAG